MDAPENMATRQAKQSRTSSDTASSKRERRPRSSQGQRQPRQREEPFPPLSISLDAFLVDGSDREFRQLIQTVLRTSTLMLRARERFAQHMGVSAPQYSMMAAIGELGSATVSELAARLHVSTPFVTAEVGKLVREGIVDRQPNKDDGRSSILTLTTKGQDLIRDVAPLRRLANDTIFGSLTRAQAKSFRTTMETLMHDAERALHAIDAPDFRRQRRRRDRGN